MERGSDSHNPDPEDPYPDIHEFGASIHGNGTTMIVGADQGNRAFVFNRAPSGAWAYAAQLRPSDAYTLAHNFGNQVRLRDNIAVVGSWAHHENGLYSGAVYVFDDVITLLTGDIDADGDVDFVDRDLFVSVLLGVDQDAGHITRSDINADATADGLDVIGFVNAMLGL